MNFGKMKIKWLIEEDYVSILKSRLGYKNIEVVNIRGKKIYEHQPTLIRDYFNGYSVVRLYHVLADNQNIYIHEIKKGVHLNGNYEYKKVIFLNEAREKLHEFVEVEDAKTKKREIYN